MNRKHRRWSLTQSSGCSLFSMLVGSSNERTMTDLHPIILITRSHSLWWIAYKTHHWAVDLVQMGNDTQSSVITKISPYSPSLKEISSMRNISLNIFSAHSTASLLVYSPRCSHLHSHIGMWTIDCEFGIQVIIRFVISCNMFWRHQCESPRMVSCQSRSIVHLLRDNLTSTTILQTMRTDFLYFFNSLSISPNAN